MDLFRVRLNYLETYQASPTKFDPPLRNHVKLSQAHKEPKIPIIRVFGSTETGQKVCAHIHGAFPYLYIEYTGDLTPEVVGPYIHRLHLSIDYALSVSYKRDLHDGNSKFVARITVVKGIPFYGFHVGYRYYLKIYMLDPMVMTRLADLLRQGIVMKMVFQPFEAHLQYLLQWMVDYNLYGCDYIDCSRVAFRSPLPKYEELASPSHLWHDASAAHGQISDQSELPRISHCSIEVDICVQDITNRHDVKPRSLHHDFIEHLDPALPDEKLVRSMASLWKNEARRRKSRISDLEPNSSRSSNVPISMSAGPRKSQPGGWVHEEEYKDKMTALIMEEKNKSDGANISFSTFVKHNSLEPTIRTSLEAVEDLFPQNLRTSLGISLDNTTGETDYGICYDDRVVDEQRISTFIMNGHDQINPDSDDDVLSERVAPGEPGEHYEGGILNLVDTDLEGNDIDCRFPIGDNRSGDRIHSPSDPGRLTGAANPSEPHSSVLHNVSQHSPYEAKESGYMWDNLGPFLSHDPPIQLQSQILENDLKRVEIPEVQTDTTPKRQKLLFDQVYNRAQSSRPILDPECILHRNEAGVSFGRAAVAGNDSTDTGIATHKPTVESNSIEGLNATKEVPSQHAAVTHGKPKNQPLRPPIINDSNTSHIAVRLNATPPNTPRNGRDHPFGVLLGLANASRPVRPSIVSLSSSAKVTLNVSSHIYTPAGCNSNKRTARVALFRFTEPPPSPTTVISTMQKLHLPRVIHQGAFYSSESDVPEHNREWAGREFKLTSLTTPFLPEFNPSGKSEASSNGKLSVVLEKLRREEGHQRRRHACGLRSWEIAMHPPSHFEVRRWLHTHKSSTFTTGVNHHATSREGACSTERSKLSQIDGPTQKNKHGFKYTQDQSNPSNTQQEAQYMSIMSLEIHVNTRTNFVPDPEEDEIQCIFWCFQSNEGLLEDNIDREEPRLGAIVLSGDGSMARKIAWHGHIEIYEETSELDLMIKIVEIVRDHDPDILTGFEVHGNSWGYLIERARQRYDYDLSDELSRIKIQSHRRNDKSKDKWGFNNTSTIRVTGRHVINIWRAMRNELNLLQYTIENITFHLLHRRIPHFTWSDLTRWYSNGRPQDISKVVGYYLSRVRLDLDILEKNGLIARTSEQARILGVDFFSVFSRGSQFKVESLMFRIAKSENFLLVSPSRKQVGGQNALECLPLVMEPQSAFYNGPMLVLDFQSLYPSVMIAYNYCYSTCLGRVVNWRGTNKMGFTEFHREQRLMELLKDHINIAPNGIMYTKPEIRQSLLAKMLSEILETRVMVKAGMKINQTDKALQRLLNNRQLALKLIANVTYGYTSASFSGRMPCSEIADSIVQTGRETLEKAIALIHSVDRWGAEVVYGDTDSLFVYLKGRTKDQAFDIGQEIAETITNMNPRPVKLKFEKVYFPCVLVAKKRYVGFKYNSRDQEEPIFDAKGIETVRRDGTPAEQMIEEMALKILFRTSDLSQVKDYFQKQCEKIMKGSVSIQDFCFAREVKLGTYSGKGPPPPGALISTKRMLLDARAEPQYGERIRYVVVTGAPGARLIDRCVAPDELLDDDHAELDAEYYILKNLIPPLERIFNLVGANVRSWYDEMPKFQRIRRVGNNFQLRHSKEPAINKKILEAYMRSSSCLVCGERVDSDGPMCTTCQATKSQSLLSLQNRLGNAEREFMNLQKICRSCSGISPLDEVRCDSKDCPVFYTRTKQKARLNTERAILQPVLGELAESSVDPRDLEW